MSLKDLTAYELVTVREVADFSSQGYYLKHKKSGARVCVLSNSDENKVFYIGFRTPPADSRGIPHIIEHTVLCGSRKFPLKDPFIELVKGSMNTFLNAMTYPDKTLYPVASCNAQDFANLMDVYLDSVFYPNIYKNINIFRQEGWHYELADADSPLAVNGIVYNEMKGVYSSAESMIDREILHTLYPDTPYSNDSGGDPLCIPDLTYEAYLDFHRTYYHPSNSYIYLYGDLDVEERLRFLDEEYLSAFDRIEVDSKIPLQPAFDKPAEKTIPYSILGSESPKKKTCLSVNWSIGSNLDPLQYIAFDLLDFALLSKQGAPVKQALVKAGIGEDILGGYDSGTLQPVFTIAAKNAEEDQKEDFLKIIDDVLRDQVKNGISRKSLRAALHTTEFKLREGDFGSIPKGLMIGLQVMDAWLYAEDDPFIHIDSLSVCDQLRDLIETDYFEKLVQEYLIDNPHRAVITAVPEADLNEKNEAALQKRLDAYKATLTDAEIADLIREEEELHAFGEEPSTEEELRTIPLLTREDMNKYSPPLSNEWFTDGDLQVLLHAYDTSGILYLELLFDAGGIAEEDLPYAGILYRLFNKLNTKDYKYSELSEEIHLYTGGMSANLTSLQDLKNGGYKALYSLQIRTLQRDLAKSLKLAKSMLFDAIYTDEKRLKQVLTEMRARLCLALSESGHQTARYRACSYFSPAARFSELVSGITFYKKIEQIVDHFDEEKQTLQEKLASIASELFVREKLLISCTATREQLAECMPQIADFYKQVPHGEPAVFTPVSLPDVRNEGFIDASQIQYVAAAGQFDTDKYPYTGALRIFKSIMGFDYLWTNIRVRGGAYGCFAGSSRAGMLFFSSYRDPNLEDTLAVYRNTADYLRGFDADEREMTKFIIGTFSEIDAPLTPQAKGRRSMSAYISGITRDMLQKERDEVLGATAEDIRALADYVDDAMQKHYICVIGNEKKLSDREELFDSLTTLSNTEALSGDFDPDDSDPDDSDPDTADK